MFRATLLNLAYSGPRPPSLASGCLAGWAMADQELAASVELGFHDAFIDEDPAAVAARVAAGEPGLVGFSCYVWNVERSLATARALKALLPGCRVVLGGPEAGGLAADILGSQPAVDFVATGEGEETFRRLLRALALGDGEPGCVPGLALRREGAVRKTPEAPLIELKGMPSPFLQGRVHEPRDAAFVIVETSRGCPFTCKFCDWGPRKMRYMDLDRVEADLAYALERWDYVATNDADILMEKGRALEVMRRFLRLSEGRDAVLGIETNPVHLWPEVVDLVARNPRKFYFAFGLQSVSPEVNRLMDRPFDLSKIESRLDRFQAACPETDFHFSLIFGMHGDTLAGFRDSVEWALRRRPARLALNQCLALPGSRLHQQARDLGVSFQAEPPHRVLSTPAMTPADMAAARRLTSTVNFVFGLRPLRDMLLADAGPGSRVVLFEEWASAMTAAGLELEVAHPFEAEHDGFPYSSGERAARDAAGDPLLLASLMQAARTFIASRRPARPARGPARRPVAAAKRTP